MKPLNLIEMSEKEYSENLNNILTGYARCKIFCLVMCFICVCLFFSLLSRGRTVQAYKDKVQRDSAVVEMYKSTSGYYTQQQPLP